ncbi:NADPH-dependent F420 reductase [Streptomyces mirabilis]|uniref:NADPH-dependent F420 reductase n=1 Tax=Streptomyces mirabilis TaxID=68239 RepID=UPI0036C4878E
MATHTRYAIIGTGNIGSALAILFDRAGIDVSIANTRGPESIPEFGTTVHAVTLEEALESDVIFIAIPFLAVEDFGKKLPNWDGKIVIDTTNAYYAPNAEAVLKGRLSSDFAAEALPGAVIVKAFNQLPAKTLAAKNPSAQSKRVLFVSSNSEDASTEVARLVEQLGLAAVELGRIDEGGRLIQAPNALVLRNLVEQPFA